LLGGARDGGVRIVTGAAVTAVTERSGRVTGVETTAGRFDADWVVNAAGAWASRIACMAGLEGEVTRSYRRHLFVSAPDTRVAAGTPFVWDLSRDLYFRSDGGRLTLSPCDDEPHDAVTPGIDGAAEESLKSKLPVAFPALAPVAIDSIRACLRTFAADRRYVIGPDSRLAGFFWVAGLGGSGATAGAAIGEMAAGLLRGKASPGQERFSPSRLVSSGAA
jgi:D-arginine dehydrogenase